MRDLEDEKRIKEYMQAKMKHIKMYNESMNLVDGLDVAKFAELVRADERQACIGALAEPVAWHEPGSFGNVTTHKKWALENGWEPLYTAPPKKEWVGLTDEEIKEIVGFWGDTPVKGYTRKLFDQIEAKLKEKNT